MFYHLNPWSKKWGPLQRDPQKKNWGSLSGGWIAHDRRDEVVDFVNTIATKTRVPVQQVVEWCGLARGKFYDWRKRTVVVTLGITIDGTKVPLGIWLGSTENSRVCTAMLQNLLERGLRIDESILCVVDGGKGIRKALVDVLGDLAVIQRCQLHYADLRIMPTRDVESAPAATRVTTRSA